MLTSTNEIQLIKLFETYIECERQLEIARLSLAERQDFDPFTWFNKIIKNNIGCITPVDLNNFLKSQGLYIMDKDIKNIFKVYDSNNDGLLSQNDYLSIILPKTNPLIKDLFTNNNSISNRSILPNTTDLLPIEWNLSRIFEKEITWIRKIELLKEDIASLVDFSISDIFHRLGGEEFGGITQARLKEYFMLKNSQLNNEDAWALMKRLDKDNDGKISWFEFIDAIIPLNEAENLKEKVPSTGSIIKEKVRMSRSPNRIRADSPSKRSFEQKSLRNDSNIEINKNKTCSIIERTSTSTNNGFKSTYFDEKNDAFSAELSQTTIYPYNNNNNNTSFRSDNRLEILSTNISSKIYNKNTSIGSPIKLDEEKYLAEIFKNQIDMDKNLENLKIELSLRTDFNLVDAFRFFDPNCKGTITLSEFSKGLANFGIYPSHPELYLILRKYDGDVDGFFRFNDFCNMISPSNPDFAKNLSRRPPSYAEDDRLSNVFTEKTIKLYSEVLNDIINNEINSDNLRQKLSRRPLFNLADTFKILDINEKGFLTVDDIKNLLINNGNNVLNDDLLILMKRFDKANIGKISLIDFIKEITPKSPTHA